MIRCKVSVWLKDVQMLTEVFRQVAMEELCSPLSHCLLPLQKVAINHPLVIALLSGDRQAVTTSLKASVFSASFL